MKPHKILWFGLLVVAAGWVILLSEAQLNLLIASFTRGETAQTSSLNLGIIAQSAILSGFGVAILGALATGFSALNQFLVAILARNGKLNFELPLDLTVERKLPSLMREPPVSGKPVQSEAKQSKEGLVKLLGGKSSPILYSNRKRSEEAKSNPRKIVERGWVKDRAYVLFADGAVEVETMLGLRRFPSLQDAQEFIS